MDPLSAAFLLGIGGFAAWTIVGATLEARQHSLGRRRARRLLRHSPPLTSDSPDSSAVQVTGVVCLADGESPLRSPLCGTLCVIYRTRIASRVRSMLRPSVTMTLQTRPFMVDCGGAGRLIVESSHAVLDLEPTLVPFRRRGGHAETGFDYEESVEVGAAVRIAGVLSKQSGRPSNELGFRDSAPTDLRLVGSERHPIAVAVIASPRQTVIPDE